MKVYCPSGFSFYFYCNSPVGFWHYRQILITGKQQRPSNGQASLHSYYNATPHATFHHLPPPSATTTHVCRPGSTTSNKIFDADDLLRREITTLWRLLALASAHGSGVTVVPSLKLSKKAGMTWNVRTSAKKKKKGGGNSRVLSLPSK